MSTDDTPHDDPPPGDGSTTSVAGTPMAVRSSLDRQSRTAITVVVTGPIVWAAHFLLVYLVAEAGCTGGGPGLTVFDPPVPTVFTVAATVVAALGCLASGVWAYRRWRAGQRNPVADESGDPSTDREVRDLGGSLAFIGVLLSGVSLLSVLMVGVPALALSPCSP